MTLWTTNDLEDLFQQKITLTQEISGVSIDTRTLSKGDLYICIKGENFDPHDFLQQANEKGASAFIAYDAQKVPNSLKAKTIIVKDSLESLTEMARFARARTKAKIIGVTGSVGKTTTKNLFKKALEDQCKVFTTSGNFNNHIGLPLMLVKMPLDTEIAILEMGMQWAGEISKLSQIAKPSLSIITNIDAAHIGFFDSLEDIARAKSEIFDGMEEGSSVILNHDDQFFNLMRDKAHSKNLIVHSFSMTSNEPADAVCIDSDAFETYSRVQARIRDAKIDYTLNLPGKQYISNSLIVLLAVDLIHYNIEKSAASLKDMQASSGRGHIEKIPFQKGEILLLDDSYNAAPLAVQSSINHLRNFKDHRKILVLGDMCELGDFSESLHYALKDPIINSQISKFYCCGDMMGKLFSTLPIEIQGAHTATSSELWPFLEKEIKENDLIFFKSAKAMKINYLVEKLKNLSKIDYSK